MYKKIIKMDKKTRHDMILELDYENTINYRDYIKAQRGSGLYNQNIYKEDKKYLKSIINPVYETNKIAKKMTNPIKMIGGKTIDQKIDNMAPDKFETYIDENYLNDVYSMPNGIFCKQQVGDSDTDCLKRSYDLDKTLTLLKNYSIEDLQKKHFWKILIFDFIEFLTCCERFYTNERYDYIKYSAILPISNVILATPEYTKVAMKYIMLILSKEPTIYIREYHHSEDKRIEIKKLYGTNSAEYVNIKKCQNDLIKKHGFGLILINKIMYKLRTKY